MSINELLLIHRGHAVVYAVRVRTETVGVRLAILDKPDKKNDETNNRYQSDEIPSATLAYVVKKTPNHCQTRHEKGYLEEVD